MRKIKKGDNVVVIAGRDKGKRGDVARIVDDTHVIVNGVNTVKRLENGHGATLENTLRVARALGVLELIAKSVDPYSTDVGRVRADEALPERVRGRRST